MERLQKSMTIYVKTLSKRNEGEDREKTLPVAYLGSTMVNHGEDFENDSEFGQCLISALPNDSLFARIPTTEADPDSRHGTYRGTDCTDSGDLCGQCDCKLA